MLIAKVSPIQRPTIRFVDLARMAKTLMSNWDDICYVDLDG